MFFNSVRRVFITLLLLVLLPLALPVLAKTGDESNDEALDGLEWREIGPYRGGRVTTVAGLADNTLLYYMGATGGGVWKSSDAGRTWEHIGPENSGQIAKIEIHPTNPDIAWVAVQGQI